ncbi:hypothetical protein HK104_001531, partial [Borealophlyctis nickersoniae]
MPPEIDDSSRPAASVVIELQSIPESEGADPIERTKPERQLEEDDPVRNQHRDSPSPKPSANVHEGPLYHYMMGIINTLVKLDRDMVINCTKVRDDRLVVHYDEYGRQASLAGFLCSLPVLITPIASRLGPAVYLSPIATIFFFPVRTVGAMLEALCVGCLGLLVGTIIEFLGEACVVWYNQSSSASTVGASIILFTFIFVGMFLVAWARVKYPRLSVGTTISIRSTLQELRSFLNLLTTAYLDPQYDPSIVEAVTAKHASVRKSIAKTNTALHESRFELTVDQYAPAEYKTIMEPMQEMMKYLGGMVKAVETKAALMQAAEGPEVIIEGCDDDITGRRPRPRTSLDVLAPHTQSPTSRSIQPPITTSPHLRSRIPTEPEPTTPRSLHTTGAPSTHLHAEIALGHHVLIRGREIIHGMYGGSRTLFLSFLDALRPTVQCLSDATEGVMDGVVTDVLDGEWREGVLRRLSMRRGRGGTSRRFSGSASAKAFGVHLHHGAGGEDGHGHDPEDGFGWCEEQDDAQHRMNSILTPLCEAMERFDNKQWTLVESTISSLPSDTPSSSDTPTPPIKSIFREEYLLSFFFIFNLRECAKATKKIGEAAQSAKMAMARRGGVARWWVPTVPVGKWLREVEVETPPASSTSSTSPSSSAPRDIPPNVDGALSSITPTRFGGFRYALWRTLCWFKKHEARYAIKMILVVMSPTVGGSLQFGVYRVLGTLAGAVWGYITWVMAPGNPQNGKVPDYFGWVEVRYVYMSTPHARLGTTAMLTYNVVVMIAYVNHQSTNETIMSYALKRMATMLLGVLVSILVTSYVYPFLARVQLRHGLSTTLFNMGTLYSHLALLVSDPTTSSPDAIRAMEAALRKQMDDHLVLVELTMNEPRLRGPFPVDVYRECVERCRNMVERMGSIRKIMSEGREGDQEEFVSRMLVEPVGLYRRDMFAAILLHFHVLAGSMASKTPLPAFLPAARAARLRLMAKIRELPFLRDPRFANSRDAHVRYLYFLAYSLATEDVIEELEGLSDCVRQLFGQVRFGQPREWGSVHEYNAFFPIPMVRLFPHRKLDSDSNAFAARWTVQQAKLHLPLFPTTTVGSFPQTKEVRVARQKLKKGEYTVETYNEFIKGEIEKCIKFQEE